MTNREDLLKILTETHKCIDELGACVSGDPSKVQGHLSSALNKLDTNLVELSVAGKRFASNTRSWTIGLMNLRPYWILRLHPSGYLTTLNAGESWAIFMLIKSFRSLVAAISLESLTMNCLVM